MIEGYGYDKRPDPEPRRFPLPTALTSGGSAAGKAPRQEARGVTKQIKEGELEPISEESVELGATSGSRFYDEITRTIVGNRWEEILGAWSIASNKLRNDPTQDAERALAALAYWPASSEMVVQAKLGYHDANAEPGLVAKWDEAGDDGWHLRLTATGWELWENAAGVWNLRGSYAFTPQIGVEYEVKLYVADDVQKVWDLTGLVIDETEAALNGVVGRAGVWTHWIAGTPYCTYDDFCVYENNQVICTGLLDDQTFIVGDIEETPVAGTATLDLGNVMCPQASATVLNSDRNPILIRKPLDGVWGGDEYAMKLVKIVPNFAVCTVLACAMLTGEASRLTWAEVLGSNGYEIQHHDGDGVWAQLVLLPGEATEYIHEGLGELEDHYYRIRTLRDEGESEWGPEIYIKTLLNRVTDLQTEIIGPYNIQLTWTDNSANEDGYKIERSDNGAAFAEIDDIAANSEDYLDTGLNPETVYAYRVRPYIGASYGAYSGEDSGETESESTSSPQVLPAWVYGAAGDWFWPLPDVPEPLVTAYEDSFHWESNAIWAPNHEAYFATGFAYDNGPGFCNPLAYGNKWGIPAGATIDGYKVRARCHVGTLVGNHTMTFRIRNMDTGAWVGNAKTHVFGVVDSDQSHWIELGGAADKWGAGGAMDRAFINSIYHQLRMTETCAGGQEGLVHVDYVEISVYYTP